MKEEIKKQLVGPWVEIFNDMGRKEFWELLETPLAAVSNMIASKRPFNPDHKDIFRAFHSVRPEKLKVVIVGQDPYPQPGVADGLAFSSKLLERPQSLRNIFDAILACWGKKHQWRHFFGNDLQQWADQGVMLLNTRLTCDANAPGSHNIGWEPWISKVLLILAMYMKMQNRPYMFFLWGGPAQKAGANLLEYHPDNVLTFSHPANPEISFTDCKHFYQANQYFTKNNQIGINWFLFPERSETVSLELRHLEDAGYPIRYMLIPTAYLGFISDYIRFGVPKKFDPVLHDKYCSRLAKFEAKRYKWLDFKSLAEELSRFSEDKIPDCYLMLVTNRSYPALLPTQKNDTVCESQNASDVVQKPKVLKRFRNSKDTKE